LLRARAPAVRIPASALPVPLVSILPADNPCPAQRVLRGLSMQIQTHRQFALGVALASMPPPVAPPVPHALQERRISTPTRRQRARTAAQALTQLPRRRPAIHVLEGVLTPIPLRQRSVRRASQAFSLPRKPSCVPHVLQDTLTLMKIHLLHAIRTTFTCALPVHTPWWDLQNAHLVCLDRLT
jgi:hypothetical protein